MDYTLYITVTSPYGGETSNGLLFSWGGTKEDKGYAEVCEMIADEEKTIIITDMFEDECVNSDMTEEEIDMVYNEKWDWYYNNCEVDWRVE